MAFIIIIYKNNNIFIFISNKVNIFYKKIFTLLYFNRSAKGERKINLTDVVYFGMFAIIFIAYFYCIFQVKDLL